MLSPIVNIDTVAVHIKMIEPKVLDICIGISIDNHYYHVRGTNPSNDLPYHNWYHTLCMVLHCYEAATQYNLPMSSVRAVCVSALWHDYAHSGGSQHDSVNITRAIRAFNRYHQSMHAAATRFCDNDLCHVDNIIAVTQYPYIREPFCIEQRIIRDADLLQITLPTWYEMCIVGLGKEQSVKYGREISEHEMIVGQIAFLKEIKTYTNAFERNMAILPERISHLIDLSSV